MCEFKIIKKNDDSQISEDIVILSYTENNELLFRDILGMGETLESALILEVNTLNQTCVVFEHPVINNFIKLIRSLNDKTLDTSLVDELQQQLEDIKSKV